MERPRDVLERVARVRELVRVGDPGALGGREEQAVVRADVEPALAVAERERAAMAADARIDDREVDADGHVGQRVREHERPLQHRLGGNPVRDVDDLGLRRDPLDHAVAGADEVVLEAEVGEEGDEHRLAESTTSGGSRAMSLSERLATAAARPSLECGRASATMRRPASRGRPRRLGPDRDDRELRRQSAARALAAEADARMTRSAAGKLRRLRARACGRGATTSAPSSSGSSVRAPSAAANSTRPGGLRQLGEQALLGRDGRHEVGAAERLGRRRADRSDPRQRAGGPAHAAHARRSRS